MSNSREPLPKDIRPLFDAAWQEVALISAKWRVMKQLFATSEERVALLNRTARDFFSLAQHAFVSDILLAIGRLLDPATMGKKENLSLSRLYDAVKALGEQSLTSRLEVLLSDLRHVAAAAKEHRNRRLAHNDLATVLADGASPLQPVTIADIDRILEGLGNFLNAIDQHYRGSTTFFADTIQDGDGESLVRWLRDGVAHREESRNRQRIAAGLPPVAPSLPPEA